MGFSPNTRILLYAAGSLRFKRPRRGGHDLFRYGDYIILQRNRIALFLLPSIAEFATTSVADELFVYRYRFQSASVFEAKREVQ